MLLEPGDERFGEVGILGVPLRELVQHRQRDLGLLTFLAEQAESCLLGTGTGVAEQALVDVADLLHVDIPEGQAPGLLALEAGDLQRAQHVEHDSVGNGEQQGAAGIGGRQEGKAFGVE